MMKKRKNQWKMTRNKHQTPSIKRLSQISKNSGFKSFHQRRNTVKLSKTHSTLDLSTLKTLKDGVSILNLNHMQMHLKSGMKRLEKTGMTQLTLFSLIQRHGFMRMKYILPKISKYLRSLIALSQRWTVSFRDSNQF